MDNIHHYPLFNRILHWVMLPLLLLQIAVGFWSAQLPLGFERFAWLSRHKSFGMLLLFLLLLRLFWRLMKQMPAYPASMSLLQKRAATLVHYSLYSCMFLLPLSGWLMASAAKLPPSFFGWFAFPALIEADKALKIIFNQIHTGLVWFFCFLILVHVMAALFHFWVVKDRVFERISLWRNND